MDAGLFSQSDVYEYNPATNQWTAKAPFIGTPVFGSTTAIVNNKAYLFFGDDWDIAYWKHNEVYSYDPALNAWAYVTAFPGDGRRDAVGFTIGNKIFIGTGNNNSYIELNDWWEFNPANNQWIARASFLGTPRSQAVGFTVNGKGYLGTGGVEDVKDFWEYDPATNTWQGINEFAGAGRENSMSFVLGNRAFIVAGTSGINYNDCWEFVPALVTDINQNSSVLQAETYPNPAIDYFVLDVQGISGEDMELHLFNQLGEIVRIESITLGRNHISRSNLASGTYYYSIISAKQRMLSGTIIFQ